jgi:hypothetical protein
LNANDIANASYLWSGPNGFESTLQNPIILDGGIANTGSYQLIVTIQNCSSEVITLDVSVIQCDSSDFFIPEGFSPNNDGVNDVFYIRGIQNFPENDLT